MIKTGRQVNVLLGHGDVSKFSLLGGSFGKAGDVVLFGSGAQSYLRSKPKDTRLGSYSSAGGTSDGDWSGGRGGEPRDRYHQK